MLALRALAELGDHLATERRGAVILERELRRDEARTHIEQRGAREVGAQRALTSGERRRRPVDLLDVRDVAGARVEQPPVRQRDLADHLRLRVPEGRQRRSEGTVARGLERHDRVHGGAALEIGEDLADGRERAEHRA